MIEKIFIVTAKQGKKIYLSKERWKHILTDHSELNSYLDEIQETLKKPLKITRYSFDENVRYYYTYQKRRKNQAKYILVIVKYLNGVGYIITAYFVRYIK